MSLACASGTVVVTGSAGAIGRAVTARLLDDGHHVVALDRTPAYGGPADHGRLVPHTCDLTDEAAYDALPDLVADLPPLLALVNVAGVFRPQPVLETSARAWREQLDVNAFAVLCAIRTVAGLMVKQQELDPDNRRSVVTVSSNAGSVPRAGMAAYAASKAAATALTRSAGLELARHGIRANVVAPGTTRSPMLDELGAPDEVVRRSVAGDPTAYRTGIPLGRVADPDDVADVVAFLASPAARHLTVQELMVDGGASQR